MKYFKRSMGFLLLIVMVTAITSATVLAAANPLIDPSAKGSITIHKYDYIEEGNEPPATGDVMTIPATAKPLDGIQFKVTRVVDGSTSATGATPATGDDTYETTLTTGLDDVPGVATFTLLNQGIYLVEELSNAGVTTNVDKFLVSIPMTNPTGDGWLYNIHVYPKNQKSDLSIEKYVLNSAKEPTKKIQGNIGDTVTWAIQPSIPVDISTINLGAVPPGYFYITDTLNTRLDFKSVQVKLGTTTLQADTDFTLTAPAVDSAGGLIKVDFNKQDGIDKLVSALISGDTLEITITTKINETAAYNLEQSITNTSTLSYKHGNDDTSTVVPPTTPTIDLAGISVVKYNENGVGTDNYLNGAEFTIYTSSDGGTTLKPIENEGVDWTLTTGSNGLASGTVYFALKDIAWLNGTGYGTYYIVETKAPAGYQLLGTKKEVILSETSPQATFDLVNKKLSGGFTLPITGGAGTILFTAVGLLLIASATTLFFVSRRKNKQKASAELD